MIPGSYNNLLLNFSFQLLQNRDLKVWGRNEFAKNGQVIHYYKRGRDSVYGKKSETGIIFRF